MRKNNNSTLDIFVKKISEKGEKLLKKSDLYSVWLRVGGTESRFANAISFLKKTGQIQEVASGYYFANLSKEIDEYYWQIIAKIASDTTSSGAIIAGEKSAEILLLNNSPPQTLILYTRDASSRIRLFDGREVHFRTLVSGQKTGRKNLFSLFRKNAKKFHTHSLLFVLSPEIAILELLSFREHDVGINDFLIRMFLRKYGNVLSEEVFSEILPFRYIRAMNRLRILAKELGNDELYKKILQGIYKYGGGVFLERDF